MPPSHPSASGLKLVVQLFWLMARGFAQPLFLQDQTQDRTAAVLPPDRCSPQSSDSQQSLAAIPFYLNKCASPCRKRVRGSAKLRRETDRKSTRLNSSH